MASSGHSWYLDFALQPLLCGRVGEGFLWGSLGPYCCHGCLPIRLTPQKCVQFLFSSPHFKVLPPPPSLIQAVDWFDLPEASKYTNFDAPTPGPRVDSLHLPQDKRAGGTAPAYTHFLSPCHSPMASPHIIGRPTAYIDTLAQREIQDALKDLEITNQVNRKRRQQAGPRMSSTTSSILSYTSDSGVGDSAQWTAASSLVAANNRSVQRFVDGQKQLFNQMPKREMDAHAAAIALMNSSPHPEALSHRVPHSLSGSGRHRRDTNPHPFARNYTGAYSSDDSSSCFTLTSESDLFIPRRRYPHNNPYSESDDPHQYPR